MMARPWWFVLASLALLTHMLPGARTVDDAFITFRYSRNLVEGAGFVYNPGEAVLGTTTPLYTLLMAAGGALFGEQYPTLALIVNALAGAGGVLILFELARRLTGDPLTAGWVAAAWALAPFAVTFAIGGMETPVHNLFMLAAWLALLTDRPRWLGAACALGVLTRPDALIWALPLLVFQALHGRRLYWQTYAVGLLIYTPWLLFAWATFGSPIPQTIGSKAVVYHLEPTQAFARLLQHYATPFMDNLTLGRVGIIAGLFLYPGLALIGLRAATGREARALPILIYPWLYFAVFALLNPLMFRWYLAPPLPAYFLAIACGVDALLRLMPQSRLRRAWLAAVAALSLLLLLNGWTLRPDHGPRRPAPRMAFHELELNYAAMARQLRQQYGVNEQTRLAAADIGALGYYTRAHILDTIGLVTPGTTPYYADRAALDAMRVDGQNYVVPPDLILDWQPEFVVLMDGFIREGLHRDPRFRAEYRVIESIPVTYYGGVMWAFQRQ